MEDVQIPNLRLLIAQSAHAYQGNAVRSKAIEQLHLISGELVRIYPSGKDAANFLGVSQSGISLCLHLTKPDFHGFKWRQYGGPNFNCKLSLMIPFRCNILSNFLIYLRYAYSYSSLFIPFQSGEALQGKQLSYDAMMAMQVLKNRRDTYNADEERARVLNVLREERRTGKTRSGKADFALPKAAYGPPPTGPREQQPQQQQALSSYDSNGNLIGSSGAGAATGATSAAGYQYQPRAPLAPVGNAYNPPLPPHPVMNANMPHITTSTEVVSVRLLKLKAELLNIFYLMPEKALRLPELDAAGEQAVANAGSEAAASIRAGIAKLSGSTAAAAAAVEAPAAAATEKPAVEAPAAAGAVDDAVESKADSSEPVAAVENAPVAATVATAAVSEPNDAIAAAATAVAPASTEVATTNGTAAVVTTTDAAAAPEAPAASSSSSLDLSMSNVERLADKVSRKAKRRMRRKLSLDKFLRDVQGATTAQQLLEATMNLEGAIPQGLMFKYSRAQLPVHADTLATLAVRIFALDRAIAWDEVKGVENNQSQCAFRLRAHFYPRCMQSASCNKFLCHQGKCSAMHDVNGSRIPDFFSSGGNAAQSSTSTGSFQFNYQPNPNGRPINTAMSSAAALALANQQRRNNYMQQQMALKPKDEDLPLEEVLKKMLLVRKELDIENVQPYLPSVKEITDAEWV